MQPLANLKHYSLIKVSSRTFSTACRYLSAFLLCWVFFSSGLANASVDYQQPLTLLDGKTKQLSDYKGNKPVYLKFWASWCKPCMQQMPHLQHTFEKYAEQIEIISVNIYLNETQADIDKVIEKFGLTVPTALDKDGALAKAFKFVGTPYHILLDKNGNVVHQGHESSTELDRKIELLAAQNGATIPPITLTDSSGAQTSLGNLQATDGLVLFTATWCDWYLADTRPQMAQACIDAQKTLNQLQQAQPDLHWYGLVNHLWTGPSDVEEFIKKFSINYPVAIDNMGDAFFSHSVKSIPTLIIFKEGKVRFRTTDITNEAQINEAILQWLR